MGPAILGNSGQVVPQFETQRLRARPQLCPSRIGGWANRSSSVPAIELQAGDDFIRQLACSRSLLRRSGPRELVRRRHRSIGADLGLPRLALPIKLLGHGLIEVTNVQAMVAVCAPHKKGAFRRRPLAQRHRQAAMGKARCALSSCSAWPIHWPTALNAAWITDCPSTS